MGYSMRPKARGLAQHGRPPGWLEESDPEGCDFVRDGRSMPPALTDHTTCPGLWLLYWWMYSKYRHELNHARKAWLGTLVHPRLLSRVIYDVQSMKCTLYTDIDRYFESTRIYVQYVLLVNILSLPAHSGPASSEAMCWQLEDHLCWIYDLIIRHSWPPNWWVKCWLAI
jgi:hypothetical protein